VSKASKVLIFAWLLLLYGFCAAQDDTINNPEAEKFHELCKSYFAKGNIDESISYGKKAVELDETNSDYYLWLGIAYSEKTKGGWFLKKLSNAKKSKKAFERGVELDPTSAATREGLLEYYVRAPGVAGGSFDKAREQAAEISKIDPVRGHYASAYIYQRDEEFSKTEEELKKAVEINPNETEPYFRLGGFYVNQEEYEKAEVTYLKAVENNPSEIRAYYELGWFYQIREEHEKASATFKKILEISPGEVNAYFFLTSSYLDQKEYEKADEAFSRILEINPGYTGTIFLQGKKVLLSGKDLEEGIGYLEKYLEAEPQESYSPGWAYTHLLMGIESYGPSWAVAHWVMGMIYEELGEKKQAKKEYKKALKLDPKLKKAKEALRKLK